MKKEVLFVLLPDFADWEIAYIAAFLNFGLEPGRAKYTVKTLSLSKEPVVSIGGLKVLPDYSLEDAPSDYAGLILIGGMSWFTPETVKIVPFVQTAIDDNKIVAGICNASVFLAMHGLLNEVKHTSNGLEYLRQFAGTNYTGTANYLDKQVVSDHSIITASGLNPLEFSKAILAALEADTPEMIEKNYQRYKTGIWIP